ncbi:hypothetical protein [Myxococcus sp. RHSTA-1-4]|uniref:hypothetical protein n=1 Tax=Myxococcus sp. RHSTA-1-4 TaxID=2874601 RepID=UPI001CBB6827|nr:hypothetical protein [Myxococcus sp. RHSTA-1-4]MBZ4419109.1 hypothetical protein [Myxococcus sp. RHSTA-1-4]
MTTAKLPPVVLGLAVLWGLLASGCSTGAPARAERPTYLAQSLAVDCKPGQSSMVCCIKKFPTTAAESCGASATEVAEVLNGARVLNEAAQAAEDAEESTDDFANNANLPEWKQKCIQNYVACQNEGWTGNCYACIRRCEGQRDWPLDMCHERKRRRRDE